MNKHQSNKGFTLVEVIVVAVIVAILAAVAIPLYSGYVNDARKGVVDNAAAATASFLGVAKNAGGVTVPAAPQTAYSGTITGPNGSTFTTPAGVTITFTSTAVTAYKTTSGKTDTSAVHNY